MPQALVAPSLQTADSTTHPLCVSYAPAQSGTCPASALGGAVLQLCVQVPADYAQQERVLAALATALKGRLPP
jgi:hypothetical protein